MSYLETATIRDFIIGYSQMTGSNYYNALWQLSEVDFSHPWDDDLVKKEFNIEI